MFYSFRLLILPILLITQQSLAADQPKSDLYEKLNSCCVEIMVDRHMDGVGSFVSADGYILTAAHIFRREYASIEVDSEQIGRLSAKLIAIDEGHDLALLKVKENKDGYPTLTLAKKYPKPTAVVYQFGSPIFRQGILSFGTVASNRTNYEYMGKFYVEENLIAGVTTRGSSGGPWVNRQGEIIGVQSGFLSNKGNPQGVSFASPLFAIKKLIQEKKNAQTATLRMAFEQIGEQPLAFIKKLPKDVEGIVLRVVQENGPAAKAGIKNEMILTHLNGQTVLKRNEVLKILRNSPPEKAMTLSVVSPDGTNKQELKIVPEVLEATQK